MERFYSRGYPDITTVAQTREDFLTQLSPGQMVCHARAINVADVSLIGLWEKPLCVGGTVLLPNRTGLLLPMSWDGDFLMDGHSLTEGEAYAVDSPNGFISRGTNRYFYALQVEREPLIHSLAALQGVHFESISLHSGALKLPARAKNRIAKNLHSLLFAVNNKDIPRDQLAIETRDYIYNSFLEIYLANPIQPHRRKSSWRRYTYIIRIAEDRYAANDHSGVSLADLCAATQVSSSTLSEAFNRVTGMSPIKYFKTRAINDVHDLLVESEHQRGAIAKIAMRHGFTELGRFSLEYKKVFGVSPSVTLREPIPD